MEVIELVVWEGCGLIDEGRIKGIWLVVVEVDRVVREGREWVCGCVGVVFVGNVEKVGCGNV